jgi:hypothetical protein
MYLNNFIQGVQIDLLRKEIVVLLECLSHLADLSLGARVSRQVFR